MGLGVISGEYPIRVKMHYIFSVPKNPVFCGHAGCSTQNTTIEGVARSPHSHNTHNLTLPSLEILGRPKQLYRKTKKWEL